MIMLYPHEVVNSYSPSLLILGCSLSCLDYIDEKTTGLAIVIRAANSCLSSAKDFGENNFLLGVFKKYDYGTQGSVAWL